MGEATTFWGDSATDEREEREREEREAGRSNRLRRRHVRPGRDRGAARQAEPAARDKLGNHLFERRPCSGPKQAQGPRRDDGGDQANREEEALCLQLLPESLRSPVQEQREAHHRQLGPRGWQEPADGRLPEWGGQERELRLGKP